ncbi:MAG: bifunctional 4-hydroxy-2-oxoglutarate aldolase/2-dehydro-3-deoxy-phosphogluconate aldolase [Spirochaetales bacterium]|nr:bifunctional 4-hydroxy-2-oxoglutarate aldolase/2-dehydro-3-deoxy-phosphogluconate aldolase [Spirochaetales bacterium]
MTKDFLNTPLIGILRGIEIQHVPVVFEAALNAGLAAIEITVNTPNAFDLIGHAAEHYGEHIIIGAGTVLDDTSAKQAMNCGARFLVSPCNQSDVAQFCMTSSIPFFPGALTPQEIWNAWKSGATMVKVFPAGVFGPKYFRDVKAPLDTVKLLACGGITPDTIADFIRNGADAFAFGSGIFKPEWIRGKNTIAVQKAIQQLIQKYRETINDLRENIRYVAP